MKPLLIGEANPYSDDPTDALLPWPRNASGNRLRNIMGLEDAAYLDRFDRENLCVGSKWSIPVARERARELVEERKGGIFVLLGAKVCSAFGRKFQPFETWGALAGTFVVLPHPSGLSRAWTEPDSIARAHDVLTRAGVL